MKNSHFKLHSTQKSIICFAFDQNAGVIVQKFSFAWQE